MWLLGEANTKSWFCSRWLNFLSCCSDNVSRAWSAHHDITVYGLKLCQKQWKMEVVTKCKHIVWLLLKIGPDIMKIFYDLSLTTVYVQGRSNWLKFYLQCLSFMSGSSKHLLQACCRPLSLPGSMMLCLKSSWQETVFHLVWANIG